MSYSGIPDALERDPDDEPSPSVASALAAVRCVDAGNVWRHRALAELVAGAFTRPWDLYGHTQRLRAVARLNAWEAAQ